jgi:hypothetical protein
VDGAIGARILRCSDGHLFTSGERARLFSSIHLGPKRLMRCPVDRRWRMTHNVNPTDITAAELSEAARHRV